MDLSEFKRKQSELNKQIATSGEAILAAEFKKFFSLHPEVAAVCWRQYTPYFNDGEPCIFRRYDFELSLDFVGSLNEDCEYDEDDWIDPWSDKARQSPKITSAFKHLKSTFDSPTEELFEAVFGDGVRVTATPHGFEVVEYAHD